MQSMYNTSGSTGPYWCCTTPTSERKSCSVVRAHMKPFRQLTAGLNVLVVVFTSGQLIALVHGQNIWSCLQQVIWSLICLTSRAWVYLVTIQHTEDTTCCLTTLHNNETNGYCPEWLCMIAVTSFVSSLANEGIQNQTFPGSYTATIL